MAAVALVFAGCGPSKLDVSKTYSVGGDTPAQGIELDPQAKAQTISVDFETPGEEVTVMVVKKEDAPNIDDIPGLDIKKAIASKRSKKDNFTAEIPENTAVWVAVRGGGEKRDVTLKVTNKK